MRTSLFLLFITAIWDVSTTQSTLVASPSKVHEDVRTQAPLLLYANRKDIRIFNANSRNESIIIDHLNDAIGVDFLFAEGIIFWADVNLKKIKRIRVSTGEVEDVISVDLKKPEGLAVDWIAGKLYWTDCGDGKWVTNRIEVANLDGSSRKVLFRKDLGLPRAIAVDPLLGYLFWTDWGEEPKLERSEMDGSNRRVIIRRNIHWPNGLTIDYSAQKIYWTDASLFYIDKANYDGSDRQSILRSAPIQCSLEHPFALALYADKLYWTDWKKRGILSTNKNNGLRCPVIKKSNTSPMDIRAYVAKRQVPRPGKNPCSSSTNGGCSDLCLLNNRGKSCACPTGVKLLPDNKTCEQGPVHFLLLARKVDIRRISLDTPDFTDVVMPVSGLRHAMAIDFDPVDKFVYWSDDEKLEIKRSKMDGTGVQVIINDVSHPDGIAVEWLARNLYWTDTGTDRIEVSRLDGSSRKIVISEDLDEPRAITLHPSLGYMFWTDWGKHPKIERAELDGSHRITLVKTSVVWPNGITIDFHEQKLYWVDAKLDKIEIMNLDGSNRRVILDSKLPHVFGFTVLGDRLFWTDWQRRAIESVNKKTGNNRNVILDSVPDLMGLKAVNLDLPLGSNPCEHNNGGCSHLCLYTPTGIRCECPTGMILKERKKAGKRQKRCTYPSRLLFFARKKSLRRMFLDTPDPADVVVPVPGIQHAVAIDFDPVDKFIYWSDVEAFEIKRAKTDGTGVQLIAGINVRHCHGLAVDVVARNIYWTNTDTDRIEVSRLDGSSRKVLINDHLDEPRAIALDYTRGYMFWTDWGKHPKIERAGLDGSLRVTLVNTSVAWPNGITIDFHDKKVYWADARLDKIEEMNLDGRNRRIVLDQKLSHVFGLTLLSDRLYWTDRGRLAIESCNKRTGNERQTIMGGVHGLLGIKAVNVKRVHGFNPCRRNNGGCSHLCLYTPTEVRCECPSGMTLKKRKQTGRKNKKCIYIS